MHSSYVFFALAHQFVSIRPWYWASDVGKVILRDMRKIAYA